METRNPGHVITQENERQALALCFTSGTPEKELEALPGAKDEIAFGHGSNIADARNLRGPPSEFPSLLYV